MVKTLRLGLSGHFRRITTWLVLIKITMPSENRPAALRALNRMNINRASLFPDLAGASAYCNMNLQIDKY